MCPVITPTMLKPRIEVTSDTMPSTFVFGPSGAYAAGGATGAAGGTTDVGGTCAGATGVAATGSTTGAGSGATGGTGSGSTGGLVSLIRVLLLRRECGLVPAVP